MPLRQQPEPDNEPPIITLHGGPKALDQAQFEQTLIGDTIVAPLYEGHIRYLTPEGDILTAFPEAQYKVESPTRATYTYTKPARVPEGCVAID